MIRYGPFIKAVFAGLFVLATAAFSVLQATPAVWEVEGEEGTLVVLGTMHRLPERSPWLTPDLRESLQNADTLVMETGISEAEEAYLSYIANREGITIGKVPLEKRLDRETFLEVVELFEGFGAQAATANALRPWFAAILIGVLGGEEAGYYSSFGVETLLGKEAQALGIPVEGLETKAGQYLLMSEMNRSAEVALLKQVLSQSENFADRYHELYDAWLTGNVEKTEKLVLGPLRENPDVYDTLILERNRNWVPLLEAYLEKGGRHFVAVGTGHLVGPDSVLKMLAEKGHRVVRQ